MGIAAAIVGALGGLSAVAGILNAVNVLSNDIGIGFVDWKFWFALAAILLLGAIALSVNRRPMGD